MLLLPLRLLLRLLGVRWCQGLQRACLLSVGTAAVVPHRPCCPCAQHHEAHLHSNVGGRRGGAQAGRLGQVIHGGGRVSVPVPLVTLCDPLWLPGVGLAHLIGSGVQRPSQPAHVHTSPHLLPIGAMLLVLPAWYTAARYHVANLLTTVERWLCWSLCWW